MRKYMPGGEIPNQGPKQTRWAESTVFHENIRRGTRMQKRSASQSKPQASTGCAEAEAAMHVKSESEVELVEVCFTSPKMR